jgi:hypothetical protein
MSFETPDLNYAEDIKVDPYNLDLEWAQLPGLHSKWATRLIEVENQRDRLREQIELKYAELDLEIRSNLAQYKLGEGSPERAIKSTIVKNEQYKTLQQQYLNAKYAAKVLRIAVKGIKDKEKTIDRLTKLYHDQYYMKPYKGKEEGELSERKPEDEATENTAGATAALNAHMNVKRFFRR